MARDVDLVHGDDEHRVRLTSDGASIDGQPVTVPPHAVAVADRDVIWVFLDGEVYEFERRQRGRPRQASHHGSLAAPMPATVLRINVAPGASVTRGETLLVLEAMKMELPVRAPADGTVVSISCREGELVQAGVPLLELE